MVTILTPALLERWKQSGAGGRAVKPGEKDNAGRIEILSSEATLRNIRLNPNEAVAVSAEFVLSKNYAADQKSPAQIDLIQLGAPDNPDKIVGGQRFTLDLSKISLVKSGDMWRYWDKRESPGENWTSVDYSDARWNQGTAPLGSGGNQATTLASASTATTYFRHTFEVEEPSFYRNLMLRIGRAAGVIVFLNGHEIYRVNLPAGRLKSEALATRVITGLEGQVFVPIKIDPPC